MSDNEWITNERQYVRRSFRIGVKTQVVQARQRRYWQINCRTKIVDSNIFLDLISHATSVRAVTLLRLWVEISDPSLLVVGDSTEASHGRRSEWVGITSCPSPAACATTRQRHMQTGSSDTLPPSSKTPPSCSSWRHLLSVITSPLGLIGGSLKSPQWGRERR